MESCQCHHSYLDDYLVRQFQKLRLINRNRRINVKYNEQYFPKAGRVKAYTNKSPERWFWLNHPSQKTLFMTIDLIPGTKQFNKVANPIKQVIGPCMQICNVQKVANNFLNRQYELKKDLKKMKGACVEYRMYHFTVGDNLESIIWNNFNWRFSGVSRGHKYGHGISFSPCPKFAEQFCKCKQLKIMIVVKVLVSSTQIGDQDMVLPDYGFDTTVSPKKTVYVKFEDSEFCPEYIVYYHQMNEVNC